MTLLEKFLFEQDLEKTIESYFKKGTYFNLQHKSKITGCNINYQGNQLMSLFAVEAEIECANILKLKFGNRVRHIGGNDISDIVIEGTPYVFNVKVCSDSTSSVKLFCSSTATKINNLDYRFISINYRLDETKSNIIFEGVNVFNYEYIKDSLIESKDSISITKAKVNDYVKERNKYVHGDTLKFTPLSLLESKYKKPLLNKDILFKYIDRKHLEGATYSQIYKRFKYDYNIDNISSLMNELIEDKLTSFKNDKFISNNLKEDNKFITENKVNKKVTKLDIVNETYKAFLMKSLKDVEDIKDLKNYIVDNLGYSRKLASSYIKKCSSNI